MLRKGCLRKGGGYSKDKEAGATTPVGPCRDTSETRGAASPVPPLPTDSDEPVIGIDLGTTYSAVGTWQRPGRGSGIPSAAAGGGGGFYGSTH